MEERYPNQEKWNAITHGIGAILGVLGFVLMLLHNSHKTSYSTFSIIIYSFSLIALYIASTVYHAVGEPLLKKRLRVLDHISIYLLIAGTYTPIALIALINGHGWLIFYTIWILAAIGTVFKLFFTGRFEYVSLVLYLAMGWLIVLDLGPLWEQLSIMGKLWFVLGGAFYTLGTIFYAKERIPYNHLMWHFFVLGGSLSHWVLLYIDII